MADQTVDFEDRLTPIAALDDDLYLFSASDGAIYRAGESLVLQLPPLPPQTFAVPGDDCLYSVSITDGSLSVQRRQLAGTDLDVRVLCSSEGTIPVAVIAGGTDRYVILRRRSGDEAMSVSLDTGSITELCFPRGSRPLFMTEPGHIVYQAGDKWGTSEAGTIPEPGIVTSWSSGGFIVATDPKGRRSYTHIQSTSRRTLDAPRGWEIRQAILHRGGITAVCLHPLYGYAAWDGRGLSNLNGTAMAYPLGDHEPAIRSTSCATGSSWRQGPQTWPGVVPARSDLRVHVTEVGGCPSIHITTARPSERLLVAMHGGPDSLEWDDLRYGGLYRKLVAHGTDVLIVNYPGSQGLGTEHQRRAWQAWAPILASLGVHIQEFSVDRGYSHLQMLGVSFGAWAALIASTSAEVERIAVASPILNMAAHLQRHKNESGFEAWSTARFGPDAAAARAGDDLLRQVQAEVIAIIPEGDRTVDLADTEAACETYGWQLIRVPGSHYPAKVPDAIARWEALRNTIAESSEAKVRAEPPPRTKSRPFVPSSSHSVARDALVPTRSGSPPFTRLRS